MSIKEINNPSTARLRVLRILGFGSGLLLIHVGEVLETYFERHEIHGYWYVAFAKTWFELGIGLIVAVAVSWIFDWAYHKIAFGEPVKDIENNMKELAITVGNFNQVLKSAQRNGIAAIYRRSSDMEKLEWKERIKGTINQSNEVLLIIARSLDDLLPYRHSHTGLIHEIEESVKRGVNVSFILANTFDRDTDFRRECERREVNDAETLFIPSRDTVRQLLKLTSKLNAYNKISVTLIKKSPPFAMFMNEDMAVIESYLPYTEGGKGLIMEVDGGVDIYEAHYSCYQELLKDAEPIAVVLDRWINRQSDEKSKNRYRDILPIAEKMVGFRVKLVEHPKLIFSELNRPADDHLEPDAHIAEQRDKVR